MSTPTNKSFTAQELWSKTMPFVWAKLALRLVAILIGAIILGICIFIATQNAAIGFIAILIGLSVSISVYGFMVRVFGYAIRVGHIAVLVETIKTGQLPNNQVTYGKDKVVARFKTAAVFFALDRLVDRSVQQIQRAVGSIGDFLGSASSGMSSVIKLVQKIIGIALKYVDDCCIGWIFYNDDNGQSATKGALDGIVIYFQNWKKVLGSAAKTAILVLILTFGLFLVLTLLFTWILNLMGGGLWGWLAFFLGLMISLAIKKALIDSWVMIRMLNTYMQVAPSTEIKFDLYTKLSGFSSSFKKLFDQSKGEINTPSTRPATTAAPAQAAFCGECGAKNTAGSQFCGECGKKV